jgi:hypothetical protein
MAKMSCFVGTNGFALDFSSVSSGTTTRQKLASILTFLDSGPSSSSSSPSSKKGKKFKKINIINKKSKIVKKYYFIFFWGGALDQAVLFQKSDEMLDIPFDREDSIFLKNAIIKR